jgi:TonB family protein
VGTVVLAVTLALLLAPPAGAGPNAGPRDVDEKLLRKTRSELEPLANEGDPAAEYVLGQKYRYGQGGPPDLDRAATLLRRSAGQGNAHAQTALAQMILADQVPGADTPEALAWYAKAAEQGHWEAEYDLGHLHQDGSVVPQSDAEAVHWFSRCAERDRDPCRVRLAEAYASGRGVERDEARAVSLLRQAVKGGNTEAMVHLAVMQLGGQGFEPDARAALKLLERAEKQDDRSAKRVLSRLLLDGEHVARDPSRALLLATELPCDETSLALVRDVMGSTSNEELATASRAAVALVEEGRYVSAHAPLDALARRGVTEAQFELGSLLLLGYGRPQSHAEAYKWIRLGADHDPVRAARLIETIAVQLTPAEVEALDDEVAAWKPTVRTACDPSWPTFPPQAVPAPPGGKLPEKLAHTEPGYPEQARVRRQSGRVLLQVSVDARGQVGALHVLQVKPPGFGFEEAALDAVRRWRYSPARTAEGQAVDHPLTVFVEFSTH